jgi:hypothetical protein
VLGVISGASLLELPVGVGSVEGLDVGSAPPEAPAAALGGTPLLVRTAPSGGESAQAHMTTAAAMLADIL